MAINSVVQGALATRTSAGIAHTATGGHGGAEVFQLLAAQAAPNLALQTVRGHLGAEFAVGIHTESIEDGSVAIRLVSEVRGMEGDVIVLQDIFLRDSETQMKLRPTGIRPRLLSALAQQGIDLPETMFEFRRF